MITKLDYIKRCEKLNSEIKENDDKIIELYKQIKRIELENKDLISILDSVIKEYKNNYPN